MPLSLPRPRPPCRHPRTPPRLQRLCGETPTPAPPLHSLPPARSRPPARFAAAPAPTGLRHRHRRARCGSADAARDGSQGGPDHGGRASAASGRRRGYGCVSGPVIVIIASDRDYCQCSPTRIRVREWDPHRRNGTTAHRATRCGVCFASTATRGGRRQTALIHPFVRAWV
jgi:hypothetical protein